MKRSFDFDTVAVGADLPPLQYEITADKLAAFRDATTNPHAQMITIAAKEYAYLLWSAYHEVVSINAKHQAWYSRVPAVGDIVMARGRIADRYVRRGRRYLVIETRSTDRLGAELCRNRVTLLMGRVDSAGADAGPPAESGRPVTPGRPDKRVTPTGDGAWPPLVKALTSPHIAGFERCAAALLGRPDDPTIHTDEGLARAAGLRGPLIASGMVSVAYLNEYLVARFGPAWYQGGHLSVAFVESARAGDTLTVDAAQAALAIPPGVDATTLDVWCARQDGTLTTVGQARLPAPVAGAA